MNVTEMNREELLAAIAQAAQPSSAFGGSVPSDVALADRDPFGQADSFGQPRATVQPTAVAAFPVNGTQTALAVLSEMAQRAPNMKITSITLNF